MSNIYHLWTDLSLHHKPFVWQFWYLEQYKLQIFFNEGNPKTTVTEITK